MCRNIRVLHNFEPPTTDDEVREAALQFVRKVSGSTPLSFQVEEFKSEKSAGQTYIEAKFKIAVFARGRHAEGPVETIRVETGLVRGPDKMWYLNQGTLPTGRTAASRTQEFDE